MLKLEASVFCDSFTCPFIVLVESSITRRKSSIFVPSASVSDMYICRDGSVSSPPNLTLPAVMGDAVLSTLGTD